MDPGKRNAFTSAFDLSEMVLVAKSTAGTRKSGDRKVVKMGKMAEKRALKAVYGADSLIYLLFLIDICTTSN